MFVLLRTPDDRLRMLSAHLPTKRDRLSSKTAFDRVELIRLLGTEPPVSGRHSMREWVDLITLIAVLIGGVYLGVLALGFDVIGNFSSLSRRLIYGCIGLAALWQWKRQRFH